MSFKRIALPTPPQIKAAASATVESFTDPRLELEILLRQREVIHQQMDQLDAQIEHIAVETICGAVDETQDVELYDGTLGVTPEFVKLYEPRIGQLQWVDNLASKFDDPGEAPGNVSGVRWGSGGLIANDLFITAGHCFDQFGGGWTRPQRNGRTVAPAEIASLMIVNFNYQVNGNTGDLREGDAFNVLELLEYRVAQLDFAIVRVGPNKDGQLPGEIYGTLEVAEADLELEKAMLCLIQHPAGQPKKIEAGAMSNNLAGQISYDSLDTRGGSSGSPILSPEGQLVGVHTNGGCSAFSGANRGVAIGVIRTASMVL